MLYGCSLWQKQGDRRSCRRLQEGCYAEGANVQGEENAMFRGPAEVVPECICVRGSNGGGGETNGDDHDQQQQWQRVACLLLL